MQTNWNTFSERVNADEIWIACQFTTNYYIKYKFRRRKNRAQQWLPPLTEATMKTISNSTQSRVRMTWCMRKWVRRKERQRDTSIARLSSNVLMSQRDSHMWSAYVSIPACSQCIANAYEVFYSSNLRNVSERKVPDNGYNGLAYDLAEIATGSKLTPFCNMWVCVWTRTEPDRTVKHIFMCLCSFFSHSQFIFGPKKQSDAASP